MSYDSTILADSPLAYWKLYELTGNEAADSSGNDLHATIPSVAQNLIPIVYGIGGPILTDSPTYGMSGGVARAPVDSSLDVTGTCSLEVWGYTGDPGAGTAILLTRASGSGGNGGTHIRINGQTITGNLRINGSDWFVQYGNQLPWQTWFHVVLTRNSNVLILYVNGYLRHQRTDLPTDPITLAENHWGISAIPGSGFNTAGSWGVSCAAIYNTQLSAARVLAHYEASQLVLPLRATITINLGVELNTDQIVPKDFGFAHNFSDTFGDGQVPIVEELSWKTNVNQSEPDYQQRVNAQPHGALRTLEYHLSPASGAARSRLHGCLYAPAQTYTLPVWSDMGVLTAQATSGTNTLSLDTTKRDYQVGSYVGICSDLQDPSTYQFFKIASGGVSDTALTLETNIATTVPNGSPVFPARLASISDDTLAVKSFAADHEDSIIRFEILETELSTRRITTYTPSTTYLSTEVFTLESAKVSFLDSRPYDISRRIEAKGRDYQVGKDTGSPQTFPVRFLLTSRSALSDFYGWLDARQGKQNPLWVSSKERDLTITSIPGASITVSPKTGFSLHHGRRDVEFAKTDGTFLRARVTSIVDNGSTETWTFDQTPPPLAQLVRASFLKYCTLAADTVSIRYWKGGSNGATIAECSLSFRELLTSPV